MNTEQQYKMEEVCYMIVTTVDDSDGKGSSQLLLNCERKLSDKELALIDEVCTDTINIGITRSLRRALDEVKAAGYAVIEKL